VIYTVTLNPAIDYVVHLSDALQPGAINRAAAEEYQMGGKGINVSTVLTRLGVPNVALGFVAGETGRWLEEGLAAQGLRTDFIRLPAGMTRINVKIKAGPEYQETELNALGPHITAGAVSQLQQKLEDLQPQDILVLAGRMPVGVPGPVYRQLMEPLAARGVRVVVDTTGVQLKQVLPCRPFLVKPNHLELGELFGKSLHTDEEIVTCARSLQKLGARNVLVSMAGDGALLLDQTGTVHRAKAPQGRVVNSVGAGDSMVAGFVAGVLSGQGYEYALRLGIACGSATAFSAGLADRPAIERILAEDF